MSRTYRGRHLHVFGGCGRKTQFGVGVAGYHQRRKPVVSAVEQILGPRPRHSWMWAYWYSIVDSIMADTIWPVADLHPWMKWWWVDNRQKTWYKRNGNRASRRRNRQIVHTEVLDLDWDGHFVTYKECFDKRSLY